MSFNEILKQKTPGIALMVCILFTIGGVLFCQQQALSQVTVSPSRLFFEGKPGETVSQTVTISNAGDKEYEFKVFLKDWKRDSSGSKVYEDPGRLLHSNSDHVKLNERLIVIQPGERKRVPVYMQIPQSGIDTISSNSMLFFTQIVKEVQQTNISAIGIKVGYEYGIQLFYTPYGAKPGDLDFLEFDYITGDSKNKKNKGDIRIKYKNTGHIHKTCVLQVELTNKKTGEELKLNPVDLGIMPLDSQIIHVPLPPGVTGGDYLVVALLSSDSYQFKSNLKVAKKNIYVK